MFCWGEAVQNFETTAIPHTGSIDGSNVFFIAIPVISFATFFRYFRHGSPSLIDKVFLILSITYATGSAIAAWW